MPTRRTVSLLIITQPEQSRGAGPIRSPDPPVRLPLRPGSLRSHPHRSRRPARQQAHTTLPAEAVTIAATPLITITADPLRKLSLHNESTRPHQSHQPESMSGRGIGASLPFVPAASVLPHRRALEPHLARAEVPLGLPGREKPRRLVDRMGQCRSGADRARRCVMPQRESLR